MKKLKSLVCALALVFAFTVPVLAGNMPSGGFCNSSECTSENPAPDGYSWSFVDGLYVLMSIF